MRRPIISIAALLLLASVTGIPSVLAQEPKPADIKASVPALDAMHEVIMPLWHEAWPSKDTKAMAAALPAIEKHTAAIGRAQLPGILRDKQAAWEAGVQTLQTTVAAYKSAVQSNDAAAILKQAEALHTQYEALVRIVRPLMPEIDAFHGTLYVLYHYQINPIVFEKVAKSVQDLKVKMAALNAAPLPDRFKAKSAAFDQQRTRLSTSVDEAAAAIDSKDQSKVSQAIEQMHIEYEKLTKVLEG